MNIGTHIPKHKNFLSSLQTFYDTQPYNRPCQLFSGSPKFWRRVKRNPEDIKGTHEYITQNDIMAFIHSIYLINLSKSEAEFKEKAFDCLKWELEFGHEVGFKGVVVHCGKFLKLSIGDAMANMYNNMCSIVPYISEDCPLLLETSAGQGSEICWKYDDLLEFYQLFTDNEKKKIRICIDTCHVFAAGHDPHKFIFDWIKAEPNSLVLVHYNDSQECCGEKKDRHAYPGTGHIGQEKMQLIAELCTSHNIPMVIE